MKGIYKYTDLKTGEIVYVGKDSHIDKHQRHKDHLKPSQYDNNRLIVFYKIILTVMNIPLFGLLKIVRL